jgi:hypothetical protein
MNTRLVNDLKVTADLTIMQASISNIIIGLVQHPLTAMFLLISALKLNYKLTLIVMIVTL